MPIQEVEKIWHNGKMVPWKDATIHVMTHAHLYGSSVFEGIRAYKTKHRGTCIFRNREHIERLFYSAKIYHIGMDDFTPEEIMQACRDVVRVNGIESSYIRLNASCGYGELGPYATNVPTDYSAVAFPFGAYLGEEGIKKGIDVGVSSWRRVAQGTIPAGAKAAGNYLSSRLITMEARRKGYTEGIGLSHDGTISEGGGENIFLVRDGKLTTPPMAASILGGITRDAVITFARKKGYEVTEQAIPREMLYAADEVFMTGTAAEITKIRSIDDIEVGNGDNPVTQELQQMFFGLFSGETEDEWGWLDPIDG